MKITLRNFHKYISLLISVQLLLWTISGIYFSFNKIENVRGEQYLVKGLDALKQSSELSEKLSFEESIKIIEERTTLNPISVVLIEDLMRGSEYRGRELPLYKVVSINEDDEEIEMFSHKSKITAINGRDNIKALSSFSFRSKAKNRRP